MSEPAAPAGKSLATDIKRMAPVWAVVFLAAAGSLLAIRYQGTSYLQKGLYESSDSCQVAEIHYEAGMKLWSQLNRQAAENQLERMGGSSLGYLADSQIVSDAQERFWKALELCPTIHGANDALADLAWWSGDEALAHYRLGLAHAERNELDQAQVELRTALEIADDKSRPAVALAEISALLSDWDAVKDAMAAAGDAVRKTPSGLLAIAQMAFNDGDSEAGVEALKSALDLDPGNPEAIRLVISHFESIEQPEAGADLAASYLAKAKAPTATSYHLVGLDYMYVQQWDKALAALDKALEIAPGAVVLHYDRAVILFNLGRYDAARAAAETAMNQDYRQYQALVSQNRLDPTKGP
ncbi:tetratricopeptide repeat protein [bacterium]|nr:tetratricopeptide repeat protein [bacterium]